MVSFTAMHQESRRRTLYTHTSRLSTSTRQRVNSNTICHLERRRSLYSENPWKWLPRLKQPRQQHFTGGVICSPTSSLNSLLQFRIPKRRKKNCLYPKSCRASRDTIATQLMISSRGARTRVYIGSAGNAQQH